MDETIGGILSGIWQFQVFGGAVLVLTSLIAKEVFTFRLQKPKVRIIIHTTEKAGLFGIATGCAVWLVVLIWLHLPTSGFSIGMLLGIASACLFRVKAIVESDKIVDQVSAD